MRSNDAWTRRRVQLALSVDDWKRLQAVAAIMNRTITGAVVQMAHEWKGGA